MIQLKNLVKDYGTLRAVDHINFEINEGEILGFLGPNGAGKTTTIKMITGYLSPSDGNIFVGDLNVLDHPIEIKKKIGYLPEHNPLYTEMTVYDYLKFVAEIRELQNFKQRLKEVILFSIPPPLMKLSMEWNLLPRKVELQQKLLLKD